MTRSQYGRFGEQGGKSAAVLGGRTTRYGNVALTPDSWFGQLLSVVTDGAPAGYRHFLSGVVQPETRAAWARLLDQDWIDPAQRLHPSAREEVYTFRVGEAAYHRCAGFRTDSRLLSPGCLVASIG